MTTPFNFACRLRFISLGLLSVALLTACGGGNDNTPGAVPGINSNTTDSSLGSNTAGSAAPAGPSAASTGK